jgi:hypothetical protein
MRPLALSVLSLFVLAFSDPVAAIDPASPTNPSSPTVSYITDRTPQITGTLVSMTDHSMVVNTDDGERMSFEYDSRSLVPELPAASRVKIEFKLMENGNYHAERVVPIRLPSGEIATGELRTYYDENADVDQPLAERTETSSTYRDESHDAHADLLASNETPAETHHDVVAQNETDADATTADRNDDTLPRTASAQPLIGALGMLALAGAVTLWALRRERPSV